MTAIHHRRAGRSARPVRGGSEDARLLRETVELTGISQEALARKLGIGVARLKRHQAGTLELTEPARESLRSIVSRARRKASRQARVQARPVAEGVSCADSLLALSKLADDSVDMILSDIPYGIGLTEWDVLHDNRNSAYLGNSAGQRRAGAIFSRRRKPINGWSRADRNIPREYYAWCSRWAPEWLRVLKPGGSAMVFAGRRMLPRCVTALEDAGFNFRDMLAWKRSRAVMRAQRLSVVFRRRGELDHAKHWAGWRLGNLRPSFEPIIWCFKPYRSTIADNVLEYGVGALHLDSFKRNSGGVDNVLEVDFDPGEAGRHEAQKPVHLLQTLIELCTRPGGVIVDPFAGSGSTAIAALRSGRRCLAIERESELCKQARRWLRQERGRLERVGSDR